jgi:hypothetical protein
MRSSSNRRALLASAITALVAIAVMAGISFANTNTSQHQASAAAKTKSVFNKKQTKALNKLIAAALKKKVGPTGAAGAAGATGSGPGYSAQLAGGAGVTLTTLTDVTVLTKALPAGSFIVNAKAKLLGSTLSAGNYFEGKCVLSDTPSSGSVVTDSSYGSAQMGVPAIVLSGWITLPMSLAVSTTTPSTLAIKCSDVYGAGTAYSLTANDAAINAVQTTSNG